MFNSYCLKTCVNYVLFFYLNSSDALMEISCGFPEYIRYGEILGIILPKQYRDYMVAAAFMKTACVLEPSNSKVNHKMGSIILGWV